jgi:RNA methyltransferase, TrmH family
MSVSELSSRDNSLLKTIRLVSGGSKRAPENLVLAEGIRVLEEVNRAGSPIESALFSDGFGAAEREDRILKEWRRKGVRLFRTSEKLFQTVSSVQAPQGALALVKIPRLSLDRASFSRDPLVVCACGIQDPGNLGTLIRTAAAAGATMICTMKGTVSARNPKSIRASAGSFFHLTPFEDVDAVGFLEYCRRTSIQLYRTDAADGINYVEANLRSGCAIVLGNEGSGVGEREYQGARSIRVPMKRGIESLNVAVAGGIILFEAFRQRANIPHIENNVS